MKAMKRSLALALALLMMLPLISVPAVAEEPTPTVYWNGSDLESGDGMSIVNSYPSTLQVVEEDNGNHAFRYDAVGVQSGNYSADFYAVTYNTNASKAKIYAFSESTVNEDGTVSGKVTIEGTEYTVANAIPDQNKEMSDCKGYALFSGEQCDAFIGGVNIAKAVKVKNPAVSSEQAKVIALEADYYFAKGTKGFFCSRARTSDGKYLELFGIQASGNTVTVRSHENATIAEGANVVISTDKWFTVTATVNTATGTVSIYVNGKLAFISSQNTNHPALPLTLSANTWDLIQLNRNNKTADAIGGYMMIDNPVIYDGSAFSTEFTKDFSDDFETYSVGTKIGTDWGYNSAKPAEVAAYNKVLADEDGNQFVRFPIVYDGNATISTAGSTNYDKTLMINQPGLTADDGFMVLDVSYRPHGNETVAAETIELQLRNFKFDLLAENGATLKPKNGTAAPVTEDIIGKDGIYLNLFTLYLNNGAITSPSHDAVTTGAPGLVMNEWNDIRFILNLENTSALLFVNGALYMTIETMVVTSNAWDSCTNASNLSVGGGNVIVAKANKRDGAFKTIQEADEDYSNVNYIDIDNIHLYAAKSEELFGTFDPEDYAGIVATEPTSSIRHFSPYGLRFVTRVDREKLEALNDMIGKTLITLEYGTLIVPKDTLGETDFTVEAMEENGIEYLKVKANYGEYFLFDKDETTTHFAGSIVQIKDEHLETEFAGIGYVRIKLLTGEEYYYYSDTALAADVKSTAQTVIDTTGLSGYTKAAKRAINAYAAGQSLSAIMGEDLAGLNVLALGDSLFAGTDEGTPGCDRASQWVNLLGNRYGWTLTNLGIGGMTVSYTDANYTTKGRKASMYDWLFNDINDFRWGSSYNTEEKLTHPCGQKYNYYYQCGDFTGKTAADVDLIILEGGCNDYGTEIAAPLGTIDSRDPATFLGAWNCITERLLEEYPNATIVFITTWHLNPQSRPDNLTSMEYSGSIVTLYDEVYADNDRVYMIDAGDPAVSGVNMRDTAWRTEYSNDAYHLKNNGMEVMANSMYPRLWEIWLKGQTEEAETID